MRKHPWLVIAAGVAACRPAPNVVTHFDTTSAYATFPDAVPLAPYRDTVLGIAMLRPLGLRVLPINGTCSDTFPPPHAHGDWDEEGGPMIAAALTRAALEVVADDQGIVATDEGWTAYGRGSFPHSVDPAVGSRWRLLSGSRGVGVPLEGGGMATDDRPIKVAVVDRGDGCTLALTSNFEAAELTDAVADWEMLESVRFLDARGAPDAAPGWLDGLATSQRAGLARRGALAGACLSIPMDSLRPGTPVTMVEFFSPQQRLVSYGVVRVDKLGECADAQPEAGMTIHTVEIVRSAYPFLEVAIAVLGVLSLDTNGHTLRADVDGDGVPERFGMCTTADGPSSWAGLVAETTPAPTVTWERRFSASERRWGVCTGPS